MDLIHHITNMSKLHTAKMTVAGQISIPKPLRDDFCDPGDMLSLEPFADGLLIRRIKSFQDEDFTDEMYKKQIKWTPISTSNSEAIDWEMEETVQEPTEEQEGPTCPMDEPVDPPINQPMKQGEVDPEEAARVRREMWKALLESRAK